MRARRIATASLLALIIAALAGAAAGAGALERRFPRDHGRHPESPTEWWVVGGHVRTEGERWFAVQASFGRIETGLPENSGPWSVGTLYPALIAVTDLSTGSFTVRDRVDRRGVGTVRMADERLEIAARDWTLAASDTTWHLSAHAAPIGFDLLLQPLRAAVFIGGGDGITRDEATGRNGYRYALPRMATYGRLTVGADTLAVTGISWFDHYWGDGLIEADENGWTFLDLQLRDGAELTVYRIERARGGGHGRCGGVYVSPSGVGVPLDSDQVRFYAMGADRWRSPKSNVRYPVAWRIEIPSLMISLRVTTRVPSQEMLVAGTHGFSLWRGSVEADGRRGNHKVVGAGFLEVTGLDGQFPPPLFGPLASLAPSR